MRVKTKEFTQREVDDAFELLWDKAYELFPQVYWLAPNTEVHDVYNEEKQRAYRQGCCDAFEHFIQLIRKHQLVTIAEQTILENYIKTIKHNNGF